MSFRSRAFFRIRLNLERLETRCQPGGVLPTQDVPTIVGSDENGEISVESNTEIRPAKRSIADEVRSPKLRTGIELVDSPCKIACERAVPNSAQLGCALSREARIDVTGVQAPSPTTIEAELQDDEPKSIPAARQLQHAALDARRIEPVARDARGGKLRVTPFDTARITKLQFEGTGAKAAVWQSYTDFGSAAARTNAVAAGRGGNSNETFVGGSQDDDGAVLNFDDLGTTSAGILIDNGVNQVSVTDIATNADSLIVVGNDSSTTAFALRLNPNDLSLITGYNYSVVGGSVQLDGAANGLNAANPDIFLVGTINDSTLNGYDNLYAMRYDPTFTTTVYTNYIDFGNASHGFAISADRPENAYIGGNANYEGPIRPVTLRLNASGTVQWAFYIHYGNEAIANPTNGVFGVAFLGGSSAAGGVYTVGNLQSDLLNPPGIEPSYQNTIIARWDPLLGTPLVYGTIWWVDGMDNTGTDSAVDRDGNLYKSGTTGDSVDRDAFVDKFAPSGAVVLNTDYVGGVGTQQAGNSVDLYVNSTTADVAFAGNADGAITHYNPTGPDSTYNGGNDGFVAKLSQPLFP